MKPNPHNTKRTILAIDDEPLILDFLKMLLTQAGYVVEVANCGEEGLNMALRIEPDLVLLDISMPGMSGLELAKNLREESAIPFMFLSMLDDIDIVRQAAKYGAVGYLVKPVTQMQVVPAVEAALARADEIKKLRNNEASLTTALDAGRETSMAVGVLMERHDLSRSAAFDQLRSQARSSRRKISEIAKELLDACEKRVPDQPQSGA